MRNAERKLWLADWRPGAETSGQSAPSHPRPPRGPAPPLGEWDEWDLAPRPAPSAHLTHLTLLTLPPACPLPGSFILHSTLCTLHWPTPPWGCTPVTPVTNRMNIGPNSLPDPLHTDKHWSKSLFLEQNLQNPWERVTSLFIERCYKPVTRCYIRNLAHGLLALALILALWSTRTHEMARFGLDTAKSHFFEKK
jgi:hypothetical protein